MDGAHSQYKELPAWVNTDDRQMMELCNILGILDSHETAVLSIIADYARRYQSAYLPLQGLYRGIYEYASKNNINALQVESNIVSVLKKVMAALKAKNFCLLDLQNNTLNGIILRDPKALTPDQVAQLEQKVKKAYAASDEDFARPFPSLDSMVQGFLSQAYLNSLTLKEMNPSKIRELEQGGPLTRLMLSSGPDLIVPTSELQLLSQRSYDKLRKNLIQTQDLAAFILMKMKQQYPTLSSIKNKEEMLKAMETNSNFCSAVCTEILNSPQNGERLRALFQAADIVKALEILKSEQQQKKSHFEKAIEMMLKVLEAYPLPLSRTQILQIREKQSFFKLYNERDYIELCNQFLQKYTVPDHPDFPPVIVPFNMVGDIRYVHRVNYLNKFLEKVDSLSFEIRKQIIDDFKYRSKKDLQREPVLHNDEVYEEYLEDACKDKDEMVFQTFQNTKLFMDLLTYTGTKKPEYSKAVGRFFYPNDGITPHRRSYSEMLNLPRSLLLKELKITGGGGGGGSFLEQLLAFFFGFGKTMGKAIDSQLEEKKKHEHDAAESARRKAAQKARAEKEAKEAASAAKNEADSKKAKEMKKEALKQQLKPFLDELTDGDQIDDALAKYEKKWNKTINEQARKDNLALVKTKIAHRLKMMNGYSIPIIKEETSNIMKSEDVLKAVHDREALRNYIALVMVNYFTKDK